MKYSLTLLTLACFLLQFVFVTAAALNRRDEEPTDANKQGMGGGRGGGGGDNDRGHGGGGGGGCGNGRRYGDRWYRGCNTCWCDRGGVHCTNYRCRAEEN